MLQSDHDREPALARRQHRLTAAAGVMGGLAIFGLAALSTPQIAPPDGFGGMPRPSGTLDPNLAPWWQFARLAGIGPVLAERIVAERERADGRAAGAIRYREPNDLLAVKGLGERKLRRISRFLSFPAVASSPAASRPARQTAN